MMEQTANVLEMRGITKDFSGVVVLQNVDFSLRRGEVHALVGANGAGKSTLMKIINGMYVNYKGDMILDGKKVRFENPIDAMKKGIGMIHQELDLTMNLTVAQNIYLGRELTRGGIIDKHEMINRAQALLDELQFGINATDIAGELTPAKQQLVLIARAVSMESRLIIFDEPTSSLSIEEINNLFRVIQDLQKKDVSVIYISHFLEEIFRIADRVTVLRDGTLIGTRNIAEMTIQGVVDMMVGEGREHGKKYYRSKPAEETLLEVSNMSMANGDVHDINFKIRKGEVVGLAGVLGSGRTEVGKMIFGALHKNPARRSCSTARKSISAARRRPLPIGSASSPRTARPRACFSTPPS